MANNYDAVKDQQFNNDMIDGLAGVAGGGAINGIAADFLRSDANDPLVARPIGWKRDADWIRQSFFLQTDPLGNPHLEWVDQQNRVFSSADIKYTDSSLGGNNCINPPPQFTRYADPPVKGIIPDVNEELSLDVQTGHLGMGRHYSEAIDDNSQVIHLRFGVAQFNSLTQFFTGFYSSDAGAAARTGRFTDNFFNSFIRGASNLLALALVPLVIIPVAILMLGSAVRFFMNWPTSKFYTLKPAMPLYWNAVTSMVNQIGANQGLVTYMDPKQVSSIMGKTQKLDNRAMSILSVMTDGAIDHNGTIDVFKITNRAKRLEMNYEQLRANMFRDANVNPGDPNASYFGVVKKSLSPGALAPGNGTQLPYNNTGASLEALLARYISGGARDSKISASDATGVKGIEQDPKKTTENAQDGSTVYAPPKEADDKWYDYFLANLGDGAEWASFRVDYTGPVQESFSSTTAPSSLAQKINSFTSSNHDIRMNFAGGIESIPGASAVVGAVKTVLGTVASTLHIEGLAAVAGSAFVDIPEHWESSVAQLPQAHYTMTLISPYGNPVSRMFSIYIPLAMLMAGALPLSTGKQSHTSPFLVELHDRGRVLSRLGIINELTISRGTSNLGFNNEGQPMAIDVTFGIKDLSTLMSMPIQPGFSEQPLAGLFDGDNAFTDYLMALSGMSLKDTIYRFPMLKYQAKRTMANFNAFTSKAAFMNYAADFPGVNALSAIMRGTAR